MYCYIALPLDLHVLSLPLAFILSQDQTLHCKCSFDLVLDEVSHVDPQITRTPAVLRLDNKSKNCMGQGRSPVPVLFSLSAPLSLRTFPREGRQK